QASNLNKKVGDTVEVLDEEFTVVGIYHSHEVYENGAITMPLVTLQKLLARPGSVTGFSLGIDHANPNVSIESIRQQIEALKDTRPNRRTRLDPEPTQKFVHGSLHIRMAHAMAWLTSVIALFIGAVSMLNTMIMSVLERVREIGILRAIGWRSSRVVRMVLGESLLLSLAGAAVGTVGAVLLTRWLTTLPTVNGLISGMVSPWVVAQGLLMAL